MLRLIPPDVALPVTPPGDPRIGHLLGSALREKDRPEAVLVGFPSDEGVRRNGGRVGAAEGPAALRAALHRLTVDPRSEAHRELLCRTVISAISRSRETWNRTNAASAKS